MLKTISSITNAIGALNYKGTWNATTNTPTITSSVGVKGDYYQVSVAGSTAINGISNWGVGDVIAFNGVVWQRIEGGADLNGVNLSVSGTTTLSGLTASTALALNAGKDVVSVTNTGTDNNVLSTSPSITTPRVITSINDTNGNELFGVTATGSAVNEFAVANAATGAGPTLSATGSDTNIDINITPKGSGEVNLPKVDIDGGAIDGTPIGGAAKSSGSFNAFDVTPTSKFGMRHIQGQKTGLGVSPTNQTVFSINVPYSGGTAAFFGTILLSGNYAVEQGADQVSQRSALFRIIFSRVGSNASGNTTTVFVIEESGNAYSEIGSAGSSASMDLTASVPAASATTQTVDIQITAVSDAGTASRFQWSGLYIGHTDVTFS